jgi:hypothetical protein
MEVVIAVIAVVAFLAGKFFLTYITHPNTQREKLSESSRSVERQFERPPNERDLL